MHDVHEQATKLLAKLRKTNDAPEEQPTLYNDGDAYFTATLPSTADIGAGLELVTRALPAGADLPTTSTSGSHHAVEPVNPIGFELWEALSYDLALNHTDVATVAKGYGVTTRHIKNLQANPYFAKMLQAKREEVSALGEDASFTVQMRLLANKSIPLYLHRLTDPSTPTKEFHALFKTAVELAKLMPKPDADIQNNKMPNTSITFNIQGIPGLDHLTAKAPIIGTQDTTITDAVYSEIPTADKHASLDDELLEL